MTSMPSDLLDKCAVVGHCWRLMAVSSDVLSRVHVWC